MPLECVMFCLDTSNYMRNGDLHPTRLVAQQQSVTSLARYKLEDNQESHIGLLTMAGFKVDVHISPSRDIHKLLNRLKTFKSQGTIDILSTLKVSQLTLRNRSNKHQRQRIIMYIASPITITDEQLITAGKELKKNSIALDIVLFGYESIENGNLKKAQLLIDTVQNAGNSHLVVHFDPTLIDIETLSTEDKLLIGDNTNNLSLSDLVFKGPLGRNLQPQRPVGPTPVATNTTTGINTTTRGPAAQPNTTVTMLDDDDDDADLLAAMQLSLQEFQEQAPVDTTATQTTATTTNDNGVSAELAALMGDDDEDMDADLLAAIQLSMQEDAAAQQQQQQQQAPAPATTKKDDEDGDDFNALLEAVSGGVVTEDENKKKDEEKKD